MCIQALSCCRGEAYGTCNFFFLTAAWVCGKVKGMSQAQNYTGESLAGLRSANWLQYLVNAIASLLGVVFLWAAMAKSVDHEDALAIVAQTIGHEFAIGIFVAVLWVEILVAALLLICRRRNMSLSIALALIALFNLFLVYGLRTGVDGSCGCGLGTANMTVAIWRNCGLSVLALIGIFSGVYQLKWSIGDS